MSPTDAVRRHDRPRTAPEPALRPTAEPWSGVEISIWSRLFFDGKALVLRSRGFFGGRRERRYPLSGPQGISRAVLVLPDAETAGRVRGAGEVWLLDASGRPVARLLPYQWIPAGGLWLNFEEAVRRSGISALFAACGIPVVRTACDRADAPRAPWSQELTLLLSPGPALPLWYQALRVALGGVWFLAFTVLYFSEARLPRLMLLAAVTAFLAPVARLTVRRVTALRNRSAPRLGPPPLVEVSPCPGPPEEGGTVTTRRFASRAVLRVFPGELSVVDPYGAAFPEPSAKEARHAALFPHSIGTVNSTLVMIFSSGFSLWWAPVVRIASPAAAWTSVLLGLAGLLLQSAPCCWHHLRSRWHFARPVSWEGRSGQPHGPLRPEPPYTSPTVWKARTR
ncbi:hypothetical protein OHB02_12005 [Streptomyces albidoflavus]|uniref:hypothetical protein n=1 Tax=Streptomyces TaxID=1883 RepID=UPI001E547F90|nr:hypothetical protein [Streptomyces sp. OUCMDZ-3434]WSB20897.1 hypothetical protein OHB02_12005 [Streptomyces albidoflavus]